MLGRQAAVCQTPGQDGCCLGWLSCNEGLKGPTYACHHSGVRVSLAAVQLFNLVAKSVFLLAGNVVVTDIPQFQAVIFAACMAVQTYTVIRWVS